MWGRSRLDRADTIEPLPDGFPNNSWVDFESDTELSNSDDSDNSNYEKD